MPVFSTPEPVSATIEFLVGELRITASDRDDTVAEVTPTNPSHDADVRAAEQIRIDFADGRLRVIGPRRRAVGPSKKSGSVDVSVAIPTGSNVEATISVGGIQGTGTLGDCRIKTSAGDIRLTSTARADLSTSIGAVEVESISGEANCTTSSGTVRIPSIAGRAYVKNSNGDTWLGDVHGDLRVKAANGDISVDRARSDVDAATANGSVRVGSLENGRVQLKTALGQVELGILAGTAARLDLHTSFGTVHNELDATAGPESTEKTVDVHAETSYGDIVVRRARTDES